MNPSSIGLLGNGRDGDWHGRSSRRSGNGIGRGLSVPQLLVGPLDLPRLAAAEGLLELVLQHAACFHRDDACACAAARTADRLAGVVEVARLLAERRPPPGLGPLAEDLLGV